ncbi:hypothetical protein CNY67_01840 [Desulfovibrio sp. G11]|nr:hypothetical protein CNY67_01840 [Desulfovibrio sp. G11]
MMKGRSLDRLFLYGFLWFSGACRIATIPAGLQRVRAVRERRSAAAISAACRLPMAEIARRCDVCLLPQPENLFIFLPFQE